MRKPKSVAELFAMWMARAIEVGDCLEWQGKMGNKKTIPVVSSREGRTYNAEHSVPRLVWESKKGPIPKGMLIYRTCGNNACVEFKHLAMGTRAEWMANRKKLGKTKHTAEHIVNLTKGARKRATTINSIEKAREVRALLADNDIEQVARLTGVSEAMVEDIGRGRAWKDYANPFAGLMG